MTTPKRLQQKRTKGWRKPARAVSVARPHLFGNPFVVGDLLNGGNIDAPTAVRLFRSALLDGRLQFTTADVRNELAGRPLMCFCPLDAPCHADVLLEIANGTAS